MSLRRTKIILALILLLAALAGAALAINRVAGLLAYFQQGADPAAALNLVPNRPPDLHVELQWLPDAADTGRAMEPFTRREIEDAYLRAWLQWNLAYLRGDPAGLRFYFNGPAYDATSAAVANAATQGLHVQQSNLAHRLRLRFYAADGSLIAFTDEFAQVAHVIQDREKKTLAAEVQQSRYEVVMVQEDGTWRVRHWLRGEGLEAAASNPTAPAARPGFVQRQGNQLLLDGQPYHVAGINYYPQATPWERFWPNYDPVIVRDDFARMRQMGLNTVRVFVPFEGFGGPNVQPVMRNRLADLLHQARANELRVIVTLFDFRADYQPLLWPQADRHMAAVMQPFADDPTILAWDIKNEPDLDYDTNSPAVVNTWLEHTLTQARRHAPNHLLTVGWASSGHAATLGHMVDIVSFHFYAPAPELPAAYASLRAAAPDLPLLLGEFGLPTWNSPFFPHGHSESEQARYYAEILAHQRASGSSGYLAWTLYDFNRVPASVAGGWPWQVGPQRHLGVLRPDGTPKQTAALLHPGAVLDVPPLPPWDRWLKPFWLTVYMVFGLVGWLAWRWLKHMKASRKGAKLAKEGG